MERYIFFVSIYIAMVNTGVLCYVTEENGTRSDSTRNEEFLEHVKEDKTVLSRKKRYLTFPEGSAFTSTLSAVKALLFDQDSPTNLIIEYDVIWPLPSNVESDDRNDDVNSANNVDNRIFSKRIGRPSRWRVHRRHRRDLYSAYEAALDSQGLPGKECILRTICEANSALSPPGVSIVEDLLRIVLSNVATSKNDIDEYDLAYQSKKDCDLKYSCPFSLLELLLSYNPMPIT